MSSRDEIPLPRLTVLRPQSVRASHVRAVAHDARHDWTGALPAPRANVGARSALARDSAPMVNSPTPRGTVDRRVAVPETEGLYVFVLAEFVGYQTITRVPPLLHTPLMAATNAISGISLVASLVLAGAQMGTLATVLGTIAVGCATANIVGGFLITDRMLAMFRRQDAGKKEWAKP